MPGGSLPSLTVCPWKSQGARSLLSPAAGLVTQKPFGTGVTLICRGVTFSIASDRQRAHIIEVFE